MVGWVYILSKGHINEQKPANFAEYYDLLNDLIYGKNFGN